MASPSKNEGPTIMWNMLKGKKVKTNNGKDVGEIKEISQNFLRIEKGTISKDKFWIPKYVADAYDGKTLWLLVGEEQLLQRYLYGEEPPAEQHTKDYEAFKTSMRDAREVERKKINRRKARKSEQYSKR